MPEGANSGITIAFLVPPVIIAAVSFLLAHIFEDSDRHRSFWARLRARYILTDRPPSSYTRNSDTKSNYRLTITEVMEDILYYRGLIIHYGVVSFTLLLGFALLVAILAVTILHLICLSIFELKGEDLSISWVIISSFIVLIGICLILQSTYMAQNRAIAKRMKDFEEFRFSINGRSFIEDAYYLFCQFSTPEEFQPGDITTKICKFFSKPAYRLHLRFKPWRIAVFCDIVFIAFFAVPYIWMLF